MQRSKKIAARTVVLLGMLMAFSPAYAQPNQQQIYQQQQQQQEQQRQYQMQQQRQMQMQQEQQRQYQMQQQQQRQYQMQQEQQRRQYQMQQEAQRRQSDREMQRQYDEGMGRQRAEERRNAEEAHRRQQEQQQYGNRNDVYRPPQPRVQPPSSARTVPTPSGMRVISDSTLGHWTLMEDRANPGQRCGIVFQSKTVDSQNLAFFGPIGKDAPGAIFFSGPNIPQTSQPKEIQAALKTSDSAPARVRAVHGMYDFDPTQAFIAIATDMKATMQGTTGVTWVGLKMDGTEVFRSDIDGMLQAREAMLKCMSGARATP